MVKIPTMLKLHQDDADGRKKQRKTVYCDINDSICPVVSHPQLNTIAFSMLKGQKTLRKYINTPTF